METRNVKKPEISILMSVYNESFNSIDIAVKSILKQTFKNFELILINDNPKNDEINKTLNIISKKDKRIKLIKNDINRGLGYSLNQGVLNSSADIVARMDTEDLSLPNRLDRQFSFMKKNSDVDLLFTQWIDLNEHEKKELRQPLKKDFKNIKKFFFLKSLLMHPTLMARKKVIVDNPYPEIGRPEDIVLWLKLIRKGYVFSIVEEPLYIYRVDRHNIQRRYAKTKVSSENLILHLIPESKHYWYNIYFLLFVLRTVFEYVVSRNLTIFKFTHSRAAIIWKKLF